MELLLDFGLQVTCCASSVKHLDERPIHLQVLLFDLISLRDYMEAST